MNKLFIIGNLTRDPETRATSTGKTVCSFTVAVNRVGREMGEEAEYFRVSAWNVLGESCAKYLSKGRKVAVVGSVALKQYAKNGENHAYMEISADSVGFMPSAQKNSPAANGGESEGFSDVSTDDIPF